MRIIKKIPWKALLIFAIGMVIAFPLGANYGHNVSWLSFEKTLNTKTLSEAVNKPTVENKIDNKIQIDKVKKSDSLRIIMDPTNNQQPINIISNDTCIDLSKLNKNQKNRLDRWLRD